MAKSNARIAKKAVMYLIAGVAGWLVAQEIPAMIRYYRMKRL